MTRKQFAILIGALVLLAAAGAGLVISDRSAWKTEDSRIGQKLVGSLRVSDVAQVVMRDGVATITLIQQEGAWKVKERADFAADIDRVRELLLKLVELKIVQAEPLAESQRARLLLAEPGTSTVEGSGTALELKDASGNSLGRMLLGKKVMARGGDVAPGREEGTATGRYVLAGSDTKTVVLVSDPLAQAEAKGDAWVSKDLIRVDRPRAISVSGADGRQRFAISRISESREWQFVGAAERGDLQKLQDAASALYYVRLADVVSSPESTQTGLDRPVVVRAQTYDGLTYALKIGNKTVDDKYYLAVEVSGEPAKARIPAKSESAEEREKQDKEFAERRVKLIEKRDQEARLSRWQYLVAKSSVEALLRDRAQLMPEKKAADGRKSSK